MIDLHIFGVRVLLLWFSLHKGFILIDLYIFGVRILSSWFSLHKWFILLICVQRKINLFVVLYLIKKVNHYTSVLDINDFETRSNQNPKLSTRLKACEFLFVFFLVYCLFCHWLSFYTCSFCLHCLSYLCILLYLKSLTPKENNNH